jgi:hypothetical protein
MPGLGELAAQQEWLARELLQFYDELTALHACNAFVTQALASTLAKGEGLDERSATGAVFCAQWLNDRTAEQEQKLKNILSKAQASTTTGAS